MGGRRREKHLPLRNNVEMSSYNEESWMQEIEKRRGEGDGGSKGEREHEMFALLILPSHHIRTLKDDQIPWRRASLSRRVAMGEQRRLDAEDLSFYTEDMVRYVN